MSQLRKSASFRSRIPIRNKDKHRRSSPPLNTTIEATLFLDHPHKHHHHRHREQAHRSKSGNNILVKRRYDRQHYSSSSSYSSSDESNEEVPLQVILEERWINVNNRIFSLQT